MIIKCLPSSVASYPVTERLWAVGGGARLEGLALGTEAVTSVISAICRGTSGRGVAPKNSIIPKNVWHHFSFTVYETEIFKWQELSLNKSHWIFKIEENI